MKKVICTLLLMFLGISAWAQYASTIRTGRPGQSIGPFTTGDGVLQVQAGIDWGQFKDDNNNTEAKTALFNVVGRYGITETFEISTLLNLQTDELITGSVSDRIGGLSSAQLGCRFHVNDEMGWIPATAVQARLKFNNLLSEDYKTSYISPQFIFSTKNTLTPNLSLFTNWLLGWSGAGAEPTGGYTVNLAFGLTPRIGAFVEAYGQLKTDDNTLGVDTGLSYLVNDDFQLDASIGVNDLDGLSNDITDYFLSFGISWRTLTKVRRTSVIEKYLDFDREDF